jgi:hypothetical protein
MSLDVEMLDGHRGDDGGSFVEAGLQDAGQVDVETFCRSTKNGMTVDPAITDVTKNHHSHRHVNL